MPGVERGGSSCLRMKPPRLSWRGERRGRRRRRRREKKKKDERPRGARGEFLARRIRGGVDGGVGGRRRSAGEGAERIVEFETITREEERGAASKRRGIQSSDRMTGGGGRRGGRTGVKKRRARRRRRLRKRRDPLPPIQTARELLPRIISKYIYFLLSTRHGVLFHGPSSFCVPAP